MSEDAPRSEERSDERLLDEAAEWIGRLRAADSGAADRHAFANWLARSPAHRAAFDTIADLWDGLGVLEAMPQHAVPSGPAVRGPRRRAWITPAVAAAATLAAFAVALGILITAPTTFETGIGERRTVRLDDGTRVELNTRTRLRVQFGGRRREVRIDEGGEAFFEVRPEPDRPFVVRTSHGQVRVLGTAFAVHARAERTRVTVSEGRVAVAAALAGAGAEGRAVGSGRRTSVSAGGRVAAPRPVDPARALAWREGRLVYDDVRLDEMIEDLNRYMPGRIVIADDALAEQRVSAVLRITDRRTTLRALAEILPIEYVRVSDRLVVVHPVG